MAHPRATDAPPTTPGWRIMRSDTGRLWATRERPFTVAEEAAGAYRTVDGDDALQLARAIAHQESVAETTASGPGHEAGR
ncbi:hypothetical protein AB0O28_18595 [Microbispora sp. NPDC088329]|uniref:hypothetical protein n=1 Tax=Microbispora sp. NPDC088329 TaxID=3154869 RepID=UPI0034138AC8